MTLAYNTEMMRIALDNAQTAAQALLCHDIPEWLAYRLAHIRGEAASLRAALDDKDENETTKENTK